MEHLWINDDLMGGIYGFNGWGTYVQQLWYLLNSNQLNSTAIYTTVSSQKYTTHFTHYMGTGCLLKYLILYIPTPCIPLFAIFNTRKVDNRDDCHRWWLGTALHVLAFPVQVTKTWCWSTSKAIVIFCVHVYKHN